MTQPEALRLADLLLSENAMDCLEHSDDASAELRRLHEENKALRQALAQPEREWVGLTDDDLFDYPTIAIGVNGCVFDSSSFAKLIEAKLKEKNT